MKKLIKSLFVLTLLFVLGACGNKEKAADKEESSVEEKENKEPTYQERLDAYEANKEEKIGGLVKIPETSGYSKEHVAAMFEQVDLKVEFVESTSEYVELGLCGYPNTSVDGIVEFGEIGDMFQGYYAKPGTTIIVPLRSSENGQSDSSKSTADATKDKASDSNAETDPSDVATQLKNINAQYDKMIEKVQGYIDNPTTYKTTTSIEFLQEYNKLLEEFGKLNTEAMSNDQTLQMLTDINTKHTTLLLKIGELPTPTN
ncbi:hypothetical protein [Isobaculum melis]|uniref:Lipoprotein n=1 Tax=Isobaculum melis TaxID=142588 RepID=A0A1H9SBZ0_9LACT|nr:hypothetical protein [Isobaculum melis]SER82524.1 hypothetical protein SAMN04488559_10720 [Isobaculum melis]